MKERIQNVNECFMICFRFDCLECTVTYTTYVGVYRLLSRKWLRGFKPDLKTIEKIYEI